MYRDIKTVAVLGSSGTVGSLSGGIIAQEGIDVYFLSRTEEGARKGMEKAVSQARSEVITKYITCGSYDTMLEEALSKADWILESVTENLAVKRKLFSDVDSLRKKGTVVSSTTSSLPLDEIVSEASNDLKEFFLSTHFYNPPGKMMACEITGIHQTKHEVVEFMSEFLRKKLRRVVIPVKNSVAFAGNRIAFSIFGYITSLVEQYGVELIDYIIGPYTGRLMPPLATIDLVGLDIHKAIMKNLELYTNDFMHKYLQLPGYISAMIEKGALGNKARHGFYRKLESGKCSYLDPNTCEYIPAIYPHIDFVEEAKHCVHMGLYRDAFDVIIKSRKPEASVLMNILCLYISYSYYLIGKVTKFSDGIEFIDKVMSYGFNWAPPSAILSLLGGRDKVSEMLLERGLEVPKFSDSVLKRFSCVQGQGRYFVAK